MGGVVHREVCNVDIGETSDSEARHVERMDNYRLSKKEWCASI